MLPRVVLVGRRTPAGFQAGIEIAVIVWIDARHGVLFGVGEQLELGGGRVETEQAQRGEAFAAGRNVDGESFDGDAPLSRAQVGQPDQAET